MMVLIIQQYYVCFSVAANIDGDSCYFWDREGTVDVSWDERSEETQEWMILVYLED